MEFPFFQWAQPSRPRSSQPARGVPVEPAQRKAKVVSIPVHFVGSETTRPAAALKIQKVFRGFLVRKSVKKIISIRREVEAIERRISQRETVDLIRRENKERLRVNETLMALLFKLDSVRGVDSGVRDCRKAVIKKAIALQERVDAIAAGQFDDQTLEIGDSAEVGGKDGGDVVNNCDFLVDSVEDGEVDCPDEAEAMANAEDDKKMDIAEVGVDSEAMCDAKDDEKMDIAQVGVGSEAKTEEEEEDCVVKQVVEDQIATFPVSEFMEESMETDPQISIEVGDENASERSLKDSGDKHNTELLKRVMEDNEKMMSLMTQLFEKNEVQTRMVSALTQRVEQLERAFLCDMLRRKKKRQTVDGSESTTPDQKKCGKK